MYLEENTFLQQMFVTLPFVLWFPFHLLMMPEHRFSHDCSTSFLNLDSETSLEVDSGPAQFLLMTVPDVGSALVTVPLSFCSF